MKYYQCKLEKWNCETTAWLPEKFSILNKIVKIKIDEKWENGWKVVEVGTLPVTEEDVIARSRDFTKQRKASDI